MKIVVCIKQVPGTTAVEIDPESGVLKRSGVAGKMNPFDLFALETALQIKKSSGAELTVISMGPPQAKAVLSEAFAMGADRAFLLSDRRFGGADVLATARTLSQGILACGGADLILCGKQTTDGDTAQVGSELAEFLGFPHVNGVSGILEITPEYLVVRQELPVYSAEVQIQLPCLISVEKDLCTPRLPSYKKMLQTAEREITVLNLDDLQDKDPEHYGLNGSPTRVKRIFPPEGKAEKEMWQGSAQELTERLFALLDQEKFLQQIG